MVTGSAWAKVERLMVRSKAVAEIILLVIVMWVLRCWSGGN